jgi:UDPglucose--hexose-1-phosphate uridylyltransferase
MPELRRDPVIGRWVIVTDERAQRPTDFRAEPTAPRGGFCPFCEGHESKTPPEIFALREADSKPNGPGWRVRVVPNKFPVLKIEGNLEKRAHGLYDRMTGVGAHEVFIESPSHYTSLTQLSDPHVTEVLGAYKERLVDLKRDPRMVYGMLFKNVGQAAGASLEHTHSQLIVTPVVPRTVRDEMAGAQRFFAYRDRCIFCDIIDQELSQEERLVQTTDRFVALTPYASRHPFETWIVPRAHASHFETIDAPSLEELAFLLKRVLLKIESALTNPPYNYVVHTAPLNGSALAHYHWHIEIIPRLTRIAGFEWGTGLYINPVPPESAAEFLRQTAV